MTTMRYVLIALAAAMLFAAGCNVNPSKFGKDEAAAFGNAITYVKDIRTGLCFGMIANRKTGEASQTGFGMTLVPCEAVEKYLGQ